MKMESIRSLVRSRRNEKGFMSITFAVMIVALIGFAGLAVDAGYMQWNKRRVQMAADAAAMGALREMQRQATDTLVSQAALNDSSLNGFTNGVKNTTVTVNKPPTFGGFKDNPAAVQVVVQRNVPTMFMRVFKQNTVTVKASAVARTTISYGSIGGCIFALNKTMSSALVFSGTITTNSSCSIIDESSDGNALKLTGGATVNLTNQAKISVVGNYVINGGSNAYNASVTPKVVQLPTAGITDPGDPLAAVPAPSLTSGNKGYVGAGSTTVRSLSNITYDKNHVPTNNQIQPGIYCGGINLGDSDDSTYTFMPGVYILVGGGLSVTSDAKATGTGVTFYNTATSASNNWGCTSSHSYEPLAITGQGKLTLTAPVSGNLCGMLFMGDKSFGAESGKFDQIVGGSGSVFNGALYFPKSNVKFAGSSSVNGYLVLVADNITITGNSTIGSNYSTLPTNNPFAPYSTGGGLVE
ncbi:MAG: hypothetical protein RL328_262 [Acidobacteriota bacterium]